MRRNLVLLGLLLLAFASQAQREPSAPPRPLDEAGALTIAKARLAASGRYYLELELAAGLLHLCHSGASIATYPLRDLSVGRPRVFLVPRGEDPPWVGAVWTDGRLEPERQINRIRIVPGDESTVPTPDAPGVIPPSMDELIAVPGTFEIRFKGDRAVQLILAGEVPGARMQSPKWGARWREFLAAIGLAPADAVRVRAKVAAKDGAALFRSFPDPPPEMLVCP
jgi:hypothetical protein